MGTKTNAAYQLRSAIVHKGMDLSSGHYTCLIYDNGNVYEVDDSKISVHKRFDKVKKEGYIFIYENEDKISYAIDIWYPLVLLLLSFRSKI